jgi:hypothetical protein
MVESINGRTGSGPIRENAVPDPDPKIRIWPFVDPNPNSCGALDVYIGKLKQIIATYDMLALTVRIT